MSRRIVTTSITSNKKNNETSTTNLDDDWETDPHFERHIDEIDQRWGSKRTVGSINMTKLIDEVHNDHKSIMKERFLHPSQATIDKHLSSTRSKKIITTSSSSTSCSAGGHNLNGSGHDSPATNHSFSTTTTREPFDTGARGPSINDMKKTIFERANYEKEKARPVYTTTTTRPAYERKDDFQNRLNKFNNNDQQQETDYSSKKIHETSKSHQVLRGEIKPSCPPSFSSSSNQKPSSTSPTYSQTQKKAREISEEIEDEVPKAFRSIQAKIDAYKKELETLQEAMAKKAELSRRKIVKDNSSSSNSKIYSNQQANSNIEYMDSQDGEKVRGSLGDIGASIKSMREKFDSMMREDEVDFRRRTDERRRQFFDEIEEQRHKTRSFLDGCENDEEFEEMKRKFLERNREHLSPTTDSQNVRSPNNQKPSSPTGGFKGSHSSLGTSPKVYTKRETHREEVVSKIVKENDKVIENETKRNVQHSSSCHGSSDEEEPEALSSRPIPVTNISGQSKENHHNIDNASATRNRSPLQTSRSPTADAHIKISHQSPVSPVQLSSDQRQKNKSPSPIGGLKSPSQSSTKGLGAGLMARTLFDYEAAEDDELSFDVDDLITNIEKIDVGWYKGTITSKDGSNKVGLFPANHVKLLNDDGEY